MKAPDAKELQAFIVKRFETVCESISKDPSADLACLFAAATSTACHLFGLEFRVGSLLVRALMDEYPSPVWNVCMDMVDRAKAEGRFE